MAIDFDDLNQSVIETNIQLAVSIINQLDDTLDTGVGSTIYELIIRPYAVLAARSGTLSLPR